ncbi:DUF6538 domain-containing protein [Pelagibius sp. Alg239-R121]|uniref:DUF6538 domain-containing protein n=1 Tax=Pelagibius sp. Alg239-R121 TaxID=2993448 RepID=UPI002AC31F7A|nr:DUF6538 domain-containing protein [Pelagibius sp. Alg239-R121]
MTMSKPFEQKLGIYYICRVVPEDCCGVVGKREWKVSLDTASRTEAEKPILPRLAETNQIIDDIRSGIYRRYSDYDLEQIGMSWGIDLSHQLDSYQMLPPTTQDFTDEVYGGLSQALSH